MFLQEDNALRGITGKGVKSRTFVRERNTKAAPWKLVTSKI